MPSTEIQIDIKPIEFFKEKVSSAAQNQKVEVSEHLEFYLVNLLVEYINPAKLDVSPDEDIDVLETPMAILLKKALESPRDTQVRIFKRLGDTSLYVAGFFQDFFNRKTFDIGYYIDLGSTAYSTLSRMLYERDESRETSVYKQLSTQFPKLVDIVAEVSDIPGNPKPANLLAIYDRWTRYRSDRLRRILEGEGIIPAPVSMRQVQ